MVYEQRKQPMAWMETLMTEKICTTGLTVKYINLHLEGAISATPLFLFTSEGMVNYIVRNKHHKIPNYQKE